MKAKEIKKQVKVLAKQEKFEQIYLEYGPKYFRKYVSRKYKKQDIAKLEEEGRYLDIYEKYGKDNWENVWVEDSEEELGREMTFCETTFNRNFGANLLKYLKRPVIGIMALFSAIAVLDSSPVQEEIKEAKNAKKYAKEIDEYEKAIKEYAKKFDIQAQSDLEIIMRVMKDMHETIQGYGEPQLDIEGYRGIDVMYEDGIGVCRNMAENMADKLNAINPEYNARIVTLYSDLGSLKQANIENNTIEDNKRINTNRNVKKIYIDGELKEKIIKEEKEIIIYQYEEGEILKQTQENSTKDESSKEEIQKRKEEARREQKESVINHAIVAIDIQKEKLTLLIDPTNLSLGIYQDGKIEMFNETKPDEAIQDRSFRGDANYKGIEGIIDYPIDYMKSLMEPTLSKEELKEKYGLEAQNRMLEKIEKEDKSKNFKQAIRIDEGVTYDFNTNVVTIEEKERE